ncbi:syntaxin-32-like [Syzygium oleosum]|uniref:syntaxin-32-like n=1 Tax=Syzygium oleosum TaxID=219896 RepID=UPI0024BA20E2|nr:syntaxin-32-like [Syzygium oleosum]
MLRKAAQSSFRDRTQEFQSIAERLKKSVSNGPGPNGSSSSSCSKGEGRRSGVALQSEFNRRASKIGFGIHQTSQRLAELVKCKHPNSSEIAAVSSSVIITLAKRTSLFDDPTMEIQELAAVIKQDITALNSAVVDLQLLCNSWNEGGVSSDTASHSTTVVDDLKYRLMSAAKEFIEVLTMRTEKLKVLENRRQLFSSTASEETANPFVRQCPLAAANASAAPPPPWANGSPPSSSSSPPLLPGSMTVFKFLLQWGGMAVDRFHTLCERQG